jgi:hypothetical protein
MVQRLDMKKPPVDAGGLGFARAIARGDRQWAPHPHAATAFGLFTVKPAPMSVST